MPDEPFEPKTDESWESQMVRDWLRKPFKPEQIGKLPATAKRPALDFVGHAAVTDRLNKVAPDWSYTIDNMSTIGDTIWIRGTMTIGGVSRPEFGDGPDPKQAIGNFIRRAAMRFGVALDLWSREELESSEGHGVRGDPGTTLESSRSMKHPSGTSSPAAGPAAASAIGKAAGAATTEPDRAPQAGGTTSDVGEASGSAPGGQPKPPGVTTYYTDPSDCTHKMPSGRWIRWNAEGRCPRCGTTKLLAMES